ncbi:hypothetical protein TrLO_g2499 [Triparma laevis f. longispina]|uniref:26S proteasome non-ATPase regulatory subunit 10 n=1 Tax=Triparma laevis f. longispina TaxID=1714387 RepID=A0A9W7F712_9STRA|nr:hypothetical protein TrLO_g2499 [Triparma laevis f. longispina]
MAELIEPANLDSNIHQLASFGILDGIKKLVEGETPEGEEPDPETHHDVNEKDERGSTPLVWACRNGHLEVVTYLIEHGAEVDTKSFGSMTPLHHSCNSSFEACVAKLIVAGADSNATDEEGNTCLHWAVSRGVLNIVVRLTDAGADISQSNNAGVTPLHKATIFNQVAVVKKLVDLGADVNATDNLGNTPLHHAARCGYKGQITFLRKSGATELKNSAGKTPSDLADKDVKGALTAEIS